MFCAWKIANLISWLGFLCVKRSINSHDSSCKIFVRIKRTKIYEFRRWPMHVKQDGFWFNCFEPASGRIQCKLTFIGFRELPSANTNPNSKRWRVNAISALLMLQFDFLFSFALMCLITIARDFSFALFLCPKQTVTVLFSLVSTWTLCLPSAISQRETISNFLCHFLCLHLAVFCCFCSGETNFFFTQLPWRVFANSSSPNNGRLGGNWTIICAFPFHLAEWVAIKKKELKFAQSADAQRLMFFRQEKRNATPVDWWLTSVSSLRSRSQLSDFWW